MHGATIRRSGAVLALAAVLSWPGLGAAQQQAPVAVDVAEVASATFVKGCLAYLGDHYRLHDQLQPGRDLYLPQLPPAEARPFLKGGEGEAYIRPDAGVILALIKSEDRCAVFVRRVGSEKLYKQLEKDLRVAVGNAFSVHAQPRETSGKLQVRPFDLNPLGEYREALARQFGPNVPGLRVALTVSETANPDLQAIITVDARTQ